MNPQQIVTKPSLAQKYKIVNPVFSIINLYYVLLYIEQRRVSGHTYGTGIVTQKGGVD